MNKIKTSEHVFIAGMTGSGKTYLAKNYLSGYENVFILDTKGTFNYSDIIPDIAVTDSFNNLINFEKGKIVYRPKLDEMNENFYNAFYELVYKRGNTIVYTDEIMDICENSADIPKYLKGIMTRGREINVSAWNSTQRPKTIPLVLMSETTHFFIFDLNLEADRKRINEIVCCNEILTKPNANGEKFNFWYYKIGYTQPIKGKL